MLNRLTALTIKMQLKKFWKLESIGDKMPVSEEETNCEQHYVQTSGIEMDVL